jgi:hypothetical protein
MPGPYIYVPIRKVDAAQRLVYGVFTEEAADRSGEILDYTTSKPNFEDWSNALYKSSGGKSYGNLRAMHKAVGAGIFVEPLGFDDVAKSITGVARVIDDAEWAKVEAGVYTGFSVGGNYAKRWVDPTDPTKTRYTAVPTEVSLVDIPCVKGATFEFVKGEGIAPEQRAFTTTVNTSQEIPLLSEVMEKDAASTPAPGSASEGDAGGGGNEGDAGGSAGVGSLEQVWKAADGTTFAKKADAIKHNATIGGTGGIPGAAGGTTPAKSAGESVAEPPGNDPVVAANNALAKLTAALGSLDNQVNNGGGLSVDGPQLYRPRKAVLTELHKSFDSPEAKTQLKDALRKGMYDVGRVADIIMSMRWLQSSLAVEKAREKDDSATPDSAMTILKSLCTLLGAIVAEETKELLADLSGDGGTEDAVDYAYYAAAMPKDLLKVINWTQAVPTGLDDKAVKIFTKVWDTALTATPPTAATPSVADLIGAGSPLAKFLGGTITPEELDETNEDLPQPIRVLLGKNATLAKTLTSLTTDMTKMADRIEVLSKMPEPVRGIRNAHAITKLADTTNAMGNPSGAPQGLDTPAQVAAAYQKFLEGIPMEQRARELMKLSLANPVASFPGTD